MWQPPSSSSQQQPPHMAVQHPVRNKADADPRSVHYDPRCDPNSRYYDPELDPNSRWYRGGAGGNDAVLMETTRGGGQVMRSQPAMGSGWTGGAYGVPPPRSSGGQQTPRTAPPPAPSQPMGSPPASGRRGHGRKEGNRKGGNRGGAGYGGDVKVSGGAHSAREVGSRGESLAAAGALSSTNPTDVGSLYYVLGANASSSRVKQLQQMLAARRAAEQQQKDRQAAAGGPPVDNSVAESLAL